MTEKNRIVSDYINFYQITNKEPFTRNNMFANANIAYFRKE